MGFDGATVLGAGLIVGGLGLLATAVVGLGRRFGLFDGRRRSGRGRADASRRPGRARVGELRPAVAGPGGRPAPVRQGFPARPPVPGKVTSAGPRAQSPRALEPRALEPRAPEPRAQEARALEKRAPEPRQREPRPQGVRPGASRDSTPRKELPRDVARRAAPRAEAARKDPPRNDGQRHPVPPPIQPSALVADTVLLQPVPAWSLPAPPRNDAPRIGPTAPDLARNAPHTNGTAPAQMRVEEPATVVSVTKPEVPRAVG